MKKISKGLIAFASVFFICFFSVAGTGKSEAATKKVMVGGCSIGLRLYLDGLLVVGESKILSEQGEICPGKIAGVEKGDRITKLNGKSVQSAEEFCSKIQESGGSEITLEIIRKNVFYEKKITPVCYVQTGEYKIGLWVRDSTAGIGTITCVLDDGTFAALGHGISDIDTKDLVCVKDGDVLGSKINSVMKGVAGAPGDLRGTFDMTFAGRVYKNTPQGIFGILSKNALPDSRVDVAAQSEITPGKAVIYSNIEGQKSRAI